MNSKRLTTDNPSGCTESMLNNVYAKDGSIVIRSTEDDRKDVDLCEYIAEKCNCNYSADDIAEWDCGDCQLCPYGIMYAACIQAAELRERLKQYEDKDEQGLFLDLPCRAGDTVYSYCERFNCVLAYEVEDIHIDKEQTSYFATAFDYSPSYFGEYLDEINFTDEQFHKTVFLTREEAEKALEKLRNEK